MNLIKIKKIKMLTKYFSVFVLSFLLIFLFSCQGKKSGLNEVEKKEYLDKGIKIAQASFDALSIKLKSTMAIGGVPNALKYCNLNAISLTDSLSQAYSVMIKRTSLQLRNPVNSPDSLEFEILKEYKELFTNGKQLTPRVQKMENGDILFNAPIMIKVLCLNCHGNPGKELSKENEKLIKGFYPDDQAVAYKENDFRGMWSIRFYNKSK